MSSRIQTVVYRNDTALTLPFDAVDRRGRKRFVRVVDPVSREVTEREVVIGPTALDSVEIVAGLAAARELQWINQRLIRPASRTLAHGNLASSPQFWGLAEVRNRTIITNAMRVSRTVNRSVASGYRGPSRVSREGERPQTSRQEW